jgi:hypothetical protein
MLLLGAIALASCADEPLTSEYDLAGYVTEAESGDGVRGAAVTFLSETAYGESTTTDDDGHFQMRVETDSPFGQVRAERAGFTTEEKTVYFDTRERRIDLVLQQVP